MAQIFPQSANKLPLVVAIAALVLPPAAVGFVWYYFSPRFTDVGYQPVQPVPYSHKLHAGELGLDCRYCHVNVERSFVASVPPTQVCMNCHTQVRSTSPLLNAVRKSWGDGKPVPWVRVHKVADYVYFDHSRHVTRGVGCVECHGRIDQMVTVTQKQPLSMGWCLECHRDPASHLRPVDKITTMDWEPPRSSPDQPLDEARAEFGRQIVEREKIAPPTECSRCHR